jgi:hypothetical protein
VSPTAVQRLRAHETALRVLKLPKGLGALWIVQRMPFQRSMRLIDRSWNASSPTAMHAVGLVHEIPSRETVAPSEPAAGPVGFGVCSIIHDDPFQRSTDPPSPTAVQAELEVHDTAL